MITWTNDLHYEEACIQVKENVYRKTFKGSQSYVVPRVEFTPFTSRWDVPVPPLFAAKNVCDGVTVNRFGDKYYKVTVSFAPLNNEVSVQNKEGDDYATTSDEYQFDRRAQGRRGKEITINTYSIEQSILASARLRNAQGELIISNEDFCTLVALVKGGVVRSGGGWTLASSLEAGTAVSIPNTPITQELKAGKLTESVSFDEYVIQYDSKYYDAQQKRDVCMIYDVPPGTNAPTTKDGHKVNYLLIEYSVSFVGDNTYRITEKYRQSLPGGWNTTIYTHI